MIIVTFCLFALNLIAAPNIPNIKAVKASSPPALVDGMLNDAIWESSFKTGNFKPISASGQVREKTNASFAYDKNNLYVAFVCFFKDYQAKLDEIKNYGNNVFSKDAVEVFIDPGRTGLYSHIAVNPAGSVYFANKKGDIKVGVQVFKDRYQVEMAIPFKSMGFPNPKSMGRDWGINLCRTNMAFKEWTCWSPTLAGFHNSSRFGNVTGMDVDSAKIYRNQQVENNNKRLVLSLDRTFYDKQAVVSLKYRLRIKKPLKSCVAEITVKDAKQNTVWSKRVERMLFTNRAKLPIKEWSQGKYTITIRILDKKESDALAQTQSVIWKVDTYIPQEIVTIKNQNLYVDGKLFFPICTWSWYLEWDELEKYKDDKAKQLALLEERIKDMADCGFNSAISSVSFFKEMLNHTKAALADEGYASINIRNARWYKATLDDILRLFKKYNMKLIMYPPFLHKQSLNQLDIDAWKDIMLKYRSYKGILCWMSSDESDGAIKRNLQAYKLYKELDPYRPVYLNVINMTAPNRDAADIMSTDPYPVPNSPISLVKIHGERLEKLYRNKPGKSIWLWLQMFSWKEGKEQRYPTPLQERCMAFLAMNNHIKGLAYFTYINAKKRKNSQAASTLWYSMKELNRQLMLLSKPYLLGKRLAGVKVNSKDIDLATFKYKNAIYMIAVNMKAEAVNAKIDLSRIAVKEKLANVMFESRKVKFISGKFVDKFNKYDVHIYKITK